jgi:hypothetical protein
VQAKLELPVLQALATAAVNNDLILSSLGKIQLDGSDRCLGSNAFRFRIDDADGDPLFLWASMKQGSAHAAGVLQKVSASLNALEGGVAAGVTLENWQQVASLSVPLSRKFVAGLDEEVQVALVNLSVDSIDKKMFETRLSKAHQLSKDQTLKEGGDDN